VPKTGGNRFAGDYNTTYTTEKWFATNNQAYPSVPAAFQPVKNDHDISIGAGGHQTRPAVVLRGRARPGIPSCRWASTSGEQVGGHDRLQLSPDRNQDRVEYTNVWRNVSGRVTWQASSRNKFNVFWDEQDFCRIPAPGWCRSTRRPNRGSPRRHGRPSPSGLVDEPLTNKILLEAGVSVTTQFYDVAARQFTNPIGIPRSSRPATPPVRTMSRRG
jgi:hypothetical protein